MTEHRADSVTGDEKGFSLVRNDLLFRAQRTVGLIPERGLGTVRRAVFWSLFAWLPVAAWALANGHFVPEPGRESLLQHFGINIRCLVAVPLFILAEGLSHTLTSTLLPYFRESGLVSAGDEPRYHGLLRDLARLRDAVYPWIVILGVIVAMQTLPAALTDLHELAWTGQSEAAVGDSFGGWWYLHVSRSVFIVLLLAWLWRVILLLVLFHRIAQLDLKIVPTHPDGAGGLGFIERFPKAFSPVLLAISAVASGKWAHQVLYHGLDVQALKVNMIALAVVLLLVFGAPYLVWMGKLASTRKRALLEYGALVGNHGRLVQRRWIDKAPIAPEEGTLMSAPELGPVADTVSLYDAVKRMRISPLGKTSLLALVVPIMIPMLAVLAIKIPLKDILLALLKTVV